MVREQTGGQLCSPERTFVSHLRSDAKTAKAKLRAAPEASRTCCRVAEGISSSQLDEERGLSVYKPLPFLFFSA